MTATPRQPHNPQHAGRPHFVGTKLRAIAFAALTAACALSPAASAQSTTVEDANRRCLRCHGQERIGTLNAAERRSMVGTLLDADPGAVKPPTPSPPPAGSLPEPPERPSLFVTLHSSADGPHKDVRCIDCHPDALQLPHEPTLAKATCATACHQEIGKTYRASSHGRALDKNHPLAPTCASCHGGHDVLRIKDRNSSQHRFNSLYSCGECHTQHKPEDGKPNGPELIGHYMDSAHARALTKAGLPMSATCSDCHSAHGVRPSKDPESTVNRRNVPQTCGKCHVGIVEKYSLSVHAKAGKDADGNRAVCTDCHTAHEITLASSPKFMLDVINECGRCHDSPDANGDRVGTYYETYSKSYHGQVTQLGTTRAARCSDCHGSHDILPLDDPRSKVAEQNLVATCGACHPGATTSFVQFDPHANHRDSRNYPLLHGVWLYFMIMMSGVFTFFGLHTILWFFRSRKERARLGAAKHAHGATTAIRRFSTLDRWNHAFVAITFFGLTATGIPLVFADETWARHLADVVGGVEAAGIWHRVFAVMLIINFAVHFVGLGMAFRRRTCTAKEWLFGPNSLLPRWKDAKDVLGMFRWFFGRGRPPRLDRWTYWEKFDYWAEVGGSMIIGGSGLLLWFPVLASKFVPGWTFNIAMIVHGYEALLAIGFIFTIHFFNAHLRPGTFPVDEAIFTGTVPEHELKEQRPEEYDRLMRTGKLESLRVKAPDPARRPLIVAIAVVAVGFGLLLLGLIIVGGVW